MSETRYPGPAILIHWLHALLIVALLAIGWSMVDLPKGAERSAAIALHKSLGLCALLLFLLRLIVRLLLPPPPLPATVDPLERRLAGKAHAVLYLLLLAVPLFGYLSSSFTKYPMKFFGIPLPGFGWPDESLNQLFNGLHKGAVLALVLVLLLHIAAALRHALRRDGVMSRMLPGRRRH